MKRIFVLAFTFVLLLAMPVFGAVTVGNISAADTGSSSTDTGLTFSHTANGDGLLVGLAFYVWGGSNTYSESACTATYNSVAMTKVDGFGHVSDDGMAVEAWKLVAPTAGAHNVVVSCAVAVIMHGGAISVSNAHQTVMTGTPVRVDSGFSSNPSASVTSATGGLVFAVIAARGASYTDCTAGTSETERWDTLIAFGTILACGFTEAGAASVTIEPTLNPSAGDYRSMLAVPINEVAAPLPPAARQRLIMILP